jgi:hypothetical protein
MDTTKAHKEAADVSHDHHPRPAWIPGHARRHQRCGDLDTRWMPACQCGWTFYASVRSLRIADRTHGFHLDRIHASRAPAAR